MLFISGDIPTAMIVSLHLFAQFLYNYYTQNSNNNPGIVIITNNTEDLNNNNDKENNNIYVSIPEEVVSSHNNKTIKLQKTKMSEESVLKSALKSNESASESSNRVKFHPSAFENNNQPFAPIHLKSLEELSDATSHTKFQEPFAPIHIIGAAEDIPDLNISTVFGSNEIVNDEKKEDDFFHKTGRTADSGIVLDDTEPGNGEGRAKKDRLDISYHSMLFNDGDMPIAPKKVEVLTPPKSPRPLRKISSPPVLSGSPFQGRIHKVSNPYIEFQPVIQIENYDSASPPHQPSTPTEGNKDIYDTPIPLPAPPLRDAGSVSPKSAFNAQKTWYDLFDRVRRHEDLTLPPTRQTRSYESLTYAAASQVPFGPSLPPPSSSSTRARKISTPNPPTQPMMKSIDISNLGCNDDLVLETDKRWSMPQETFYNPTTTFEERAAKYDEIKQKSRIISRKKSVLDGNAPTVIYKCVYSFRSANTLETQCSCNVILVNFDTFNDRQIDVAEIESKYSLKKFHV